MQMAPHVQCDKRGSTKCLEKHQKLPEEKWFTLRKKKIVRCELNVYYLITKALLQLLQKYLTYAGLNSGINIIIEIV